MNASIIKSSILDNLTDDDLDRLNNLLPWSCFILDSNERRFGDQPKNVAFVKAKSAKRSTPQVIPDRRIITLNEKINLRDKTVLEIGCYEGIHTIALSFFAKKVYALDSRIENVVKTTVRCNLFGFTPTVTVCNLENTVEIVKLPKVDITHHVGVLYHLTNPIKNLVEMSLLTGKAMLLDTHYATNEMINGQYEFNGKTYNYHNYNEYGRDDVFSGMDNHAKWLLKQDIFDTLASLGFLQLEIIKDEIQRNGPRMTVLAMKI